MSKKNKSGERQPSEDEEALWRHVVRDTLPLQSYRQSAALPHTRPVKPRSKNGAAVPRQPVRPQGTSPAIPSLVGLGLDKRSARRLKRGRTEIEGRLDLHGMTLDAAHGALDQFIDRSLRRGKRCVLVITGKGRRASLDGQGWGEGLDRDPRGVLREAAPNWLRVGAQGNQILAIEPARPQHGGDGAFYVLLRRKRT